jgi:hypothetical protein
MIDQHPGLVFIDGIAIGILLMVWIIHLYQIMKRHTTRRSQAIEERVALKALEASPVEIDDDRMLCPICWESKHPGQAWSLRIGSHCREHLLTGTPSDKNREGYQEYALQY